MFYLGCAIQYKDMNTFVLHMLFFFLPHFLFFCKVSLCLKVMKCNRTTKRQIMFICYQSPFPKWYLKWISNYLYSSTFNEIFNISTWNISTTTGRENYFFVLPQYSHCWSRSNGRHYDLSVIMIHDTFHNQ